MGDHNTQGTQGHTYSRTHTAQGTQDRTAGQIYTTQELENQGISKYLRRQKIQAGELYRVHRGVFITTPTRHQPTAAQIAHALTRLFPNIAFSGHTAEQIHLGKPLTLPLSAEGPRTIKGADFHITRSRLKPATILRGLRVLKPLWAAKKIPSPAVFLERTFTGKTGKTRFRQERATMKRLPQHLKDSLQQAMIGADSQTERNLAYALSKKNLRVEHNVQVAGYHFDLRIGRVLVEIDGYKYHSSGNAFIFDRQKQNAGTLHGYIVLRFSTDCIDHHLRDTVAQIEYAVALSNGKTPPKLPFSARRPVWEWHQVLMPA